MVCFRMVKPLAEFVASLHKNRVDDRNLQGHCQTLINGDTVKILVDFYEEGQYGLDIYTRESSPAALNGGKQLLTHCCKYLVNVRM
ncbi:unnamed protein product [Gongylonema pulchrum]|uniref:SH3 domain-containing protein n=1 Tax=Gongylonema pulchrum TaxID=637853 RepID=A0A183DMH2_9BILA|nr:unnamed protein product [Gongylonema pulchrum]